MEGLRSRKFALLVFAALVVVAAALFGATEAHANPPSVGCTPANPGPTGTITLTASDTSNADYLWITASSGSYTFVLDGGAICSSFHDDHTSGFPSIVVNGSTLPTTFFQEGDTDLSFTGESGVANTLDLTGLTAPATVSVIAGTATWATNNMTFANVTNFNGSFQGTDFVAGGAGGYTFTGNSSGTRLDLSAAGSGISISAASGTVSGLASGGDDNFSGVGSFVGSSSGGTTLVAGSSSLSFTGQSTGNALDFSQVATSPAFPMCINASAVFISGPCGTVFGNNAVAGLSTYTFSGVKTFTGSGNGFTSFFAGSTGGYSFTGGGSGNVLDLGAANSGVSVSVPAGTVGGLTTGGDDSFSGISTFDGPFAGNATLTAGSAGGEAFTGRGSGNTFVAGSGTATFTGGGSNDTLDFSPVVTSSGSPLHVNLSGGDVGALADDQAGFSTPIYSFSGIRNFEGASSGYTDFLGGSTVFNLQGQASGNTLDFSHASGSTLTVNESGGTVNSQATDTAQLGALTDGVTGIKSFVGLSFGSSTFRAPGTGGYSFTGEGANNSLDLSAAGSGISVSVPDGTVTGLSSGGDDTFSGIASFRGSTAGGTTVVAGSSSLSFTGQSTGNALDLSQVATSAATPLCVNVSGAPVCGSGGSSAVVGGTTAYSFDHVSSFTGSADGFTSFVAGSAGGFSFTGAGSGNSLNLAPATAGVSVSVPAGTVGGLTGGDDDFTGSFAQFVGSAAGGNSFLAGSSGGQMFTAAGNGNVFTGGSGSGDTFSGSGNGNTFVAGSGTASFSDGGSNNSLDFSPVVTSAGSPLRVNLSGGVVGALADGQAGFSTPLYTFSGITNFKGASSGYTDFLGGSSAFNLQGQASGNTLDFSHASGSTLTVNESGGTVNSQATDTAQLGAITDGSKGITNFVGLSFGNTAFLAGGTGGYSFTGQGSGDSLDLSAAGSGVTVSVPAGTVSGLTSGGDDTFSGITSFRGSSAGGTTVVAGPGSLTFLGQGTGNALDLSQTVTSAVVPLCVNVSGGPAVMASCGTVANDTASVGFLPAYVFADVSSFTGSADGFTTFAAGGTGGFSFAGGGVGNTLDLSAAPAGTTVMANGDSSGSPGSVTGLTTGTDSFSGIQHIAGPATITPATVTSVSSTLANGTYGIGKHVPVTVTFSEPVNVTGTPQLALNSGGTASYASGSGTDTLTFDYTVADGDSANPLDEASTGALTLNGGTILDALSTAATLTLPAPGADGSLGANKTIEIDTSPMLSITKTADAAVVSTGTSIGFTVTASNGAAGGTALGATLSDPLPGGTGVSWSIAPAYSGAGTCSIQGSVPNQTLGCSFGDLAPGASDSVHVMSATGAGSAGTYANTATLSALNVAGPLQASATVTVRAPALSITKTADAATVSTGSTIGFTVTASNSSAAGTGTATGVSLNDPLPGGTGVSWSVSPAYSGPGACSITGSAPSQALTCAFGTLAPGASAAVHVSSATGAGSAGSYPNTATLSASNAGTPVQASATVTVLAPALSITKTADAATVSTGSTIGFTVTASNSSAGGTGTATGVSLSDPLPGGTGVSWSIAPTYGGTGACIITGSAPTQTLSCSFGDLAPGAGDSVHVSSATGAGSAGTYANTATLTATNAGNPVRASATVTVLAPALTITKTADSSIVATGSSIGFTVAVSNGAAAGTGTATGVSLNDPLPAGTGVSWSISPAYSGPGSCSIQGSVPDQTLECSFGSLAPGAGTSVHVSSATGATSAGSYANTATLSATNAASPVQASATVTVVSPANVTSVSSTAADGTYGVAAHIPVTVTFDEPVTVTGTPRLTINSGGIATYASGNGTSALTFTYVVAAGENANPLDEASTTALSLNGGTIQAPATIDADLTLPAPGTAGSLGANKDLIVDTTPPTITFSTAANKDAGTGWYNKASSGTSGIVVSVSATDPAGISSLSCSDGATAVLSTSSSSGSFTLHDGDHNISCSAIDTVGNSGATPASTGYHAGTANAEFKVDQTAPTITSAIGAPKYGSSPVYVTTATSLTFTVGDSTSGLNSCSITVTDPSSATHSPSCGNGANVYKLDSTLIGGAPVDGSYKNVADATDVAGNAASESSFSVTLDDTAPAITITTPPSGDSANPTVYTYGSVPTASYHCDDGSGSGVASSSGCVGKADGTTVNSGSPLTGTVGLHTLTVTSKDNLGNTTSATHYYDVQAPTSILYTGDESVTYPAAVKLSATLSSPASTCVGNKTVTFTITDASNNTTVKTGTTSPSGAAGPISVSLPEGVYTVEVSYGGTANECLPSQDEATIVVGSAGSKATGGGWTTVNGVGRVNFAFVVDQVPGTGTSPANPPQYKGQYVVVKPNGWRFKGMFGNAVGGTYVVTTTKTGKSGSGTGTGTVYVWSPASATFVPATNGASVSFSIGFADNGSAGKKQTTPDQFANHVNYDPVANGYDTTLNPFPNFTLQAIKGGNITIS